MHLKHWASKLCLQLSHCWKYWSLGVHGVGWELLRPRHHRSYTQGGCEAGPSWSFFGCFWVWQVSSRVAGCWTPAIVQTKKRQPGTPLFPWYLISTQRLSYLVWLRNSLPLKLFFTFVFQNGNRKFSLLYLHRYVKIWFHLTLKNPRTLPPLPKKTKPHRKAPNPKSKKPWVLFFCLLWERFPTPQCQAVEKLYCWSSSAVLYLIYVIIMEPSTSISLLKMCFPKKTCQI